MPASEGSTGSWTFAGDTATGFDDHVERSIPWYGPGQELVVDIADHVVPREGRCYELGCSTGTLTRLLADRLAARGAEVIGIDAEPDMIAIARERSGAIANLRFETARAEAVSFSAADLVVSYYTLQFVALRERRSLLERLRRALEPAGCLVLFEKILVDPGRAELLATEIYHDWKRRRGFSDGEVAAKDRSLRGVLDPQTSAENRALLAKAGFGQPVQVYRWLCWEGLLVRADRDG